MNITRALSSKCSQCNRVDRQVANNQSPVIRVNKMLKEQGGDTLPRSLRASWKWRLLSSVLGGVHQAETMRSLEKKKKTEASGNQIALYILHIKKEQAVQDAGEKARC